MNKILKILYVIFITITFPAVWIHNIFSVALPETIKDYKEALEDDE